MARTTTARPVLLVTADPALRDGVSRLAAAAGTRLAAVEEAEQALPVWGAAAVVLVGADLAQDLAARAAPRRAEVHVVGAAPVPDAVYRSALLLGAAAVVELPGGGPWLLEALADVGEAGSEPGRSVAVVGASGGAGGSVLAAALATVAGRDDDVLLLDLDPLGPGQRLLVGDEEGPGISWRDLGASAGRLGAGALRDAVPRRERLGVLGFAGGTNRRPPPAVVAEVVAAGVRGHAWVVVDVPRRDEHDVRAVLSGCDRTVVVVHSRTGPLAAAARFAHALRGVVPSAGLVVRTHREAPTCPEVARAVGLEPWAEMRDERRLDEHLALGLGVVHARRGSLARAASQVLSRCAVTGGRVTA